MNRFIVVFAVVPIVLVTGCTTPRTPASGTADQPVARQSSAAVVTPSASPQASAASTRDLKRALVTAHDLGAPWVMPKSVNAVGKKGEVCPGHVSAVERLDLLGSASTNLTQGKGVGRNIASYRLMTIPDTEVAGLGPAIAEDQKACSRYRDASGFDVVRTVEGPTTVSHAEVVAAWTERVYYVKPHKLAYARHYVVAHQGQVVTSTSYAFLTTRKDPKAKDFSTVVRLLDVQLKKNTAVLS